MFEDGIWNIGPFLSIFDEIALDDGYAPLLYRLSEIAVEWWNFEG